MTCIRLSESTISVVALAAAVGLFAPACSSSNATTGPTTDAGAFGLTADGSVASDGSMNLEAAGQTVSVKWRVGIAATLTTDDGGVADGADASGNTNGDGGIQGLAGVRVCAYQNSAIPCVTTDADGIFTIVGLPAASNM